MIVRAIDSNNDWTFGKGLQNYKFGVEAVRQCILTRIQSWYGNCFFDLTAGIDWLNLIGGRGQATILGIQLAVANTILNTDLVNGITQLSLSLVNRSIVINFIATTDAGPVSSTVTFTPPNYLLTQSGLQITTQSGDPIAI